jgi:hypothetical protein
MNLYKRKNNLIFPKNIIMRDAVSVLKLPHMNAMIAVTK